MLGGDGTILHAAALTHGTDIPLLGINLGHVGFLAEAEREDMRTAIQRLVAGDYTVEERGTLEVLVKQPDGTTRGRLGAQRGDGRTRRTCGAASRLRSRSTAARIDLRLATAS